MMRNTTLLLLVLALASCGREKAGGDVAGNDAQDGSSATKAAVQTSSLTGLYEGGSAPLLSQMCVIDRGTGDAGFGLVVQAPERRSCSGAGTIVRQGNALRLAMAGDEECVIEARIEGTRVTLPSSLPQGCAYYCGPGARMTGVTFEKVGGTPEDAARAVDLAGDPLCT